MMKAGKADPGIGRKVCCGSFSTPFSKGLMTANNGDDTIVKGYFSAYVREILAARMSLSL